MHAQQSGDGLRWPAAKTAFGGNAELRNDSLRSFDPLPRASNTVRKVHEPQVELRLGTALEGPQRCKVGIIVPVARYWHVYPADRPLKCSRDGVGHLDHVGRIHWLLEVAMLAVAVAEVIPQLNVGWHTYAEPDKPLDDPSLDVGEVGPPQALPDGHLDRHVPLDGELAVRNGRHDLVEFGEQPRLIGRLDNRLILGHHKNVDGSQRGGETDLEAAPCGDHTALSQSREHRVRGSGCVGIAERTESDRTCRAPRAELDAR